MNVKSKFGRLFISVIMFVNTVAQAGPVARLKSTEEENKNKNDAAQLMNFMNSDPASLSAYAAAVDMHIAADPIQTAKYIAFDAYVDAGVKTYGSYDQIPPQYWVESVDQINQLERQMLEEKKQRHGEYTSNDALNSTIKALAGAAGGSAGGPYGAVAGAAVAGIVLSNVESYVAEGLQQWQQIGYATSLAHSNLTVNAAELKKKCYGPCAVAHDAVLAEVMGGVSISDNADRRLQKDHQLAEQNQFKDILAINNKIMDRLNQVATAEEMREIIAEEMSGLAQDVAVQVVKVLTEIQKPKTLNEPKISAETMQNTQAMFSIGQSLSVLLGDNTAAAAFSQLGSGVMNVMDAVNKWNDNKMTDLGMAATSLNAAVIGIQVVSMLSQKKGPTAEEQIMKQLQMIAEQIQKLHETVIKGFTSVNANILLSTNSLSSNIDRLHLKMDQVVDGLFSLKKDFLESVRSDFYANEGARDAEFAKRLQTCFDEFDRGQNGELTQDQFRRCEIDLLNAALESSSFALRKANFTKNPSLLDAAPIELPFAHHLPLLIEGASGSQGLMGSILHPMDWIKNSTAYLTLIAQNPNTRSSTASLISKLQKLQIAGLSLRQQVMGMNYIKNENQELIFRSDLHAKLLDQYNQKLKTMIAVARSVDKQDEYGKNMLLSLDQDIPNYKKEVIDATFAELKSGTRLTVSACESAGDDQFTFDDDKALTSPPGLFDMQHIGSPGGGRIPFRDFGLKRTVQLIQTSWNKKVLNDSKLSLPNDYLAMIPKPYLWAQFAGLGRVEICFARYKPAKYNFTYRKWNKYHFAYSVDMDITLQMSFIPHESLLSHYNSQPELMKKVRTYLPQAFRGLLQGIVSTSQKSFPLKSYNMKVDLKHVPFRINRGYDNFITNIRAPLQYIWNYDNPKIFGGDPEVLPMTRFVNVKGQVSQDADYKQNLKVTEELYQAVTAQKTQEVVKQTLNSDAYNAAIEAYLTHFAISAVGLQQIQDKEHALETVFGGREAKGHLLLPSEVLDLMVRNKMSDDELGQNLNNSILGAKNYFVSLGNWLATSEVSYEQKTPVIVQAVDKVLERMRLIQNSLNERSKYAKTGSN